MTFFVGYLKSKVFVTPPVNIFDLRQRIENEAENLGNRPDFIRKAVRSMRYQMQKCVEKGGHHVERVGN